MDKAVQVDERVGSRRKRRRMEGSFGKSSNASSSRIRGSSLGASLGDSDTGSPQRACEQDSTVEHLDRPQATTRLGARLKSRLKSRWYTSMLGKLSSVTEVVGAIREHKVSDEGFLASEIHRGFRSLCFIVIPNHKLSSTQITNYAITEFVQGQTRRWAVGWSLGGFRLPDVGFRLVIICFSHLFLVV